MARRAVFLDRDGTINFDVPYCSRPEDFRLIPGSPEGIRLLNEQGFAVVVITNQSGLARGFFDDQTLESIHDRMIELLAAAGARIDAIYCCPHHPDDRCACRKPKPTMVLRAAADLDLHLPASFFVGDTATDIETGRTAGCRTILIQPEPCTTNPNPPQPPSPDFVASDLLEAARWIISL